MRKVFLSIAILSAAPALAQSDEPAPAAPAAGAAAPDQPILEVDPRADVASSPLAPTARKGPNRADLGAIPNGLAPTNPAPVATAGAPAIGSSAQACASATMGQSVVGADGTVQRCGANSFTPARVDAHVDYRVRPIAPH